MSTSIIRTKDVFNRLKKIQNISEWAEEVQPLSDDDIVMIESLPQTDPYSIQGIDRRISLLENRGELKLPFIRGEEQMEDFSELKGNIEEFIGMLHVPIGITGPLVVNGTAAQGNFMVPLATTEGALVASYNRGMKACRLSGGVSSICLVEGVQRSPLFQFKTISQAGEFVHWILQQEEVFDLIIEEKSRYATLKEVKAHIEGNVVILTFEYSTGDAAGQNMVTICTEAVCKFIEKVSPIKISRWYIESNYSGDKKATAATLNSVRGKKVTSEVVVKKEIVEKVLKSTPKKMVEYWQSSTLAAVQSGSIGAQGHVANGLTALFMACGQDVACVAESAIGITRMELTEEGDLYASLTLPGLMVGTVGGGTNLPIQQECLSILGCTEFGGSKKLAEIAGALCLAGELSIAAAISAGHFTQAHQNLGRK